MKLYIPIIESYSFINFISIQYYFLKDITIFFYIVLKYEMRMNFYITWD